MENQVQEVETPQVNLMPAIQAPDECPTCLSGLDPNIGGSPLFQEALLESN